MRTHKSPTSDPGDGVAPEEPRAVLVSILVMYGVSVLLGMDYVFTASAGPNYFTRIDTGHAFDMTDSAPTKRANTQFSNAGTVWASGHGRRGSSSARAAGASLGRRASRQRPRRPARGERAHEGAGGRARLA